MESLAKQMIGQTVLITTEQYFIAPDGRQYRAVFGRLRGVRLSADTLGIKVSPRSQDWYAEVGRMVIAGCQIHYVIACDEVNSGSAQDWSTHRGKAKTFMRPAMIFVAGD